MSKKTKEAKSLLEELSTVIETNQKFLKSQRGYFSGDLITLYDDIHRIFLTLIEKLFISLPKDSFSEYKELNLVISRKNKVFDQMNSFNTDKYYQVLSLLASLDNKFKETVIENESLSGLKLKELYSNDQTDVIDLKFNLFYTHDLLIKEFEINEKLKNSFYTHLTPVLETYLRELPEEWTDSIQINRLKYLGIFATRMLAHNTSGLKKLKLKFLLTFARFILTHKSKFDQWDVISFQPDFFLVLQRLDDAHNVFFDDAIVSLLSLCEEHISKAKIMIPLFSTDSQLWKVNQARKKLETLVIKSLEDIRSSLDMDWDKIDFGRLEENEQKQILTNLSLSCGKLIYYTLQCFTCFISTTKNIKDLETLKIVNNLIQKISPIYFHPAFCILVQEYEKAIVQASLSTKIFQDNSTIIINHIRPNNNVDQHTKIPDFGFISSPNNSITPFESMTGYLSSMSKSEAQVISTISQLENYRVSFISQDTNQQANLSEIMKALVKTLAQVGSDLINKAIPQQGEVEAEKKLKDQTQEKLVTLMTGAHQYLESWKSLNDIDSANMNFFSSLLDVTINTLNSAVDYSLNILDTIIEFVSTVNIKLAPQIFDFIFAQKKSWSFVLNRIASGITTEPDSKGSLTRSERLIKAISQMRPYLEYLKDGGKSTQTYPKNHFREKEQNQALAESFFELAEYLKSFPITTVIALDDPEINNIVNIMLSNFKRSYLQLKISNFS